MSVPMGTGAKMWSIGVGLGVGSAVAVGAHIALPSPEREKELEAEGIAAISHREALASVGPVLFVAAAAIGAGLGKRSHTASVTTVALGAAAMLASTGASTMVNADNDSAAAYIRTLGVLGIAAGAGFAVGAPARVPEMMAKTLGLGLFGAAGGMFVPDTLNYVKDIPAHLFNSVQHRDPEPDAGDTTPSATPGTDAPEAATPPG